ncbi:MAG: sensor histidine kinase [Calditrichaeota bacterium]|nr:MAG: sensor histidine kinase [Calditrichota bacterium]
MKFASFHSRVHAVLVTTGIVLFLILSLAMTYFFRVSVNEVMINLQQPRIHNIFRELDRRFDAQTPPEVIRGYLQSLFLEISLGLYTADGHLLLQMTSEHFPDTFDEILREDNPLTGFSHVYYNPNPESPFHAIKVGVVIANKPIFRLMIILTVVFGLLVLAVFYAVSARLGANLRKRLSHLKAGVEEIADGRLDITLEEDDYQDEISFLARRFNQMAARVRGLIRSLEESNAARQRMFAHASHEIKSPLTSIKGFVDIIEYTDVLPEAQRQLLPEVKRDLQRVIKISNDILQLSAMRETSFKLEKQCIEIVTLLNEEHSHFMRRADKKGVRAVLKIETEKKIKAMLDPDRVAQIWDNLWYNALKYSAPGEDIVTTARVNDSVLEVIIANRVLSPIDVPLNQLFEPFYRHPAMAEKTAGSGLGLVIVRELIRAMNGVVDARQADHVLQVILHLPLEKCS